MPSKCHKARIYYRQSNIVIKETNSHLIKDGVRSIRVRRGICPRIWARDLQFINMDDSLTLKFRLIYTIKHKYTNTHNLSSHCQFSSSQRLLFSLCFPTRSHRTSVQQFIISTMKTLIFSKRQTIGEEEGAIENGIL